MYGSPTPITCLYSKNGVADAKTQTRFSSSKNMYPPQPECWRALRVQIAHEEADLRKFQLSRRIGTAGEWS